MKQFFTILKFELNGYLKNKSFVVFTLILIVVMAIVMFIPRITSAFESDDEAVDPVSRPVMALYAKDSELLNSIKPYFEHAFLDYDVKVKSGSLEQVKSQITSKEVECAFVFDGATSYTYYVNDLSISDSNTQVADEVLREAYRANALLSNGVSPEKVNEIMSTNVKGNTVTIGQNQTQNFFYNYVMIFALYMVIILYGQMVATNVATEKSSRAMELLVTSAKPTSMMFGKVISSCIAGLIQLVLLFGSALIFYNLNKSEWGDNIIVESIFDIPVNLFIYLLVFFILGFLIYAFMYGAVGSTVSKLEDISTAVMPITFVFIFAFILVVTAMTSGSVDSTLMKVCSYIPFTSPMSMFTRICMSTVAWYEIVISIVILILSTIGIGFAASKVYRVGVLLYGNRPKLSAVLNAAFKKS